MKPFMLAQDPVEGAPHVAEGAHEATEAGITIGHHWAETIPGLGVIHVDTVVYSALVMLALVIVFAALAKSVNPVPSQQSGATGTIVEGVVEFSQKIIHDFIGPRTTPYLWFIGSIFLFILAANWLSLLPWRAWELSVGVGFANALHAAVPDLHVPHSIVYHAPTADLNTTLALALISLVLYWFFGIKHSGFGGFIGHHWFAKPAALFPLRMLEDITRPASLALRLFANMTAGHVVGLVLLSLTFFVVPAILLPLELFVGAVQAFIFAALSASYIGAAQAEHH